VGTGGGGGGGGGGGAGVGGGGGGGRRGFARQGCMYAAEEGVEEVFFFWGGRCG